MSADTLDTWNATTDDELTPELVEKHFAGIWDELYITAAAVDRIVDNLTLQRILLNKALAATESAVERGKRSLSAQLLAQGAEGKSEINSERASSKVGSQDEYLSRLLSLRAIALHRLDRLETYYTLSQDPSWPKATSPTDDVQGAEDKDEDPWADDEVPIPTSASPPNPPPITLSEFLTLDIVTSALRFVDQSLFDSIRILMARHPDTLFPYRFLILDAIPAFVQPRDYCFLLPSLDQPIGKERIPERAPGGRPPDWVETDEGKELYRLFLDDNYPKFLDSLPDVAPHPPQSAAELSAWYIKRIMYVDGDVGLTDIALELVQHGASQGILGLDEIGEELSLLARLVYDTPGASDATFDAKVWSLERWRALDADEVVRGYLARSTPQTVARDVRRLVIPYLFVLEARAERAGRPDPKLPQQLLYNYILHAPLALCAEIFEASKPIAPAGTRIVKSDEDLARLALARLYGSPELDQWPTMSLIFECLPDWPPSSPEAVEGGETSADITLASLSAFVQPTTSRVHSAPPGDLFVFFSPLQAPALSRALDILDVHLECGEILARWGVPAPLAWFLQSAMDQREQKAWATRMARRATIVDDSAHAKAAVKDSDIAGYTALLNDMLRLVGPSSQKARGAFRSLGRLEVTKTFFGGLLSSGKFDVAKKLLTNSSVRKLNANSIEEICLAVSREFYDNASSGNLHVGDMKLAYDCLSVSTQTDAVRAEREFIEATSRICSFNVQSRPGSPITPIEIRLVKDRLSLVARVLSESEDAYKYPDIILELVHKLGFGESDIVAEVKVRAMLADAALQSEDFERAAEMTEGMVSLLGKAKAQSTLPVSSLKAPGPLQNVTNGNDRAVSTQGTPAKEAVEVCWHSCYQLGRQREFQDTKRKLLLLGHALRLCPPENTLDILVVWRRLESECIEATKTGKRTARTERVSKKSPADKGAGGSLSAHGGALFNGHLSDYAPSSEHLLHQGADAAALAKQTLSRVAANFPFDLRPLRAGRSASNASTVQSGADASSTTSVGKSINPRQALSRGMGWLIGDDG